MARKPVKRSVARPATVPMPPPIEPTPVVPESTGPARFSWKWVILVLLVVLGVLAVTNRGMLLAAVVEGQPVFAWDLNRTLRDRYGQQTLEGMIGEVLITKEARKAGVSVSDSDVEEKQKEILSSLGTEVNLDDFLKFQGMTKADFQRQLRMQLTVEKLLTKDLKLTDSDIDAYIATNSATLTATEPAKLREEARQAIIDNTVSEKLQTWFVEVRQKANVMKFL